MPSWSVVEFIDSKTVEAIPTLWLHSQTECYWPPMTRSKLILEIKQSTPPKECWPLYAVRVFKDATFESYETARKKAKKAEETSDLNSDIEVTKRRIVKKIVPDFDSSESEHELISNLPPPPKLCLQKKNLSEALVGTYMNELLKQMSSLKANILQVREDVQFLISQPKNIEDDRNMFFQRFPFPVTNQEDLAQIDDYLINEDNFKQAVLQVSKLGGKDTYDFVRRCFQQMITDKVSKGFTFDGTKEKRSFKDRKICSVILDASENFNGATKKDSEMAIRKWLRRANERSNAKNKNKENL